MFTWRALLLGWLALASVATATSNYHGALFGKKSGLDMTVYLAAGENRSFGYDSLTWVAMGVKFTVPYETYELLVQGAAPQAFPNPLREYIGFAGISGSSNLSYPCGKLARFSWPDGTDMTSVHIDYTDPSKTYILIDSGEQTITFNTSPPPAFIVLDAESDTFMKVTVHVAVPSGEVRNAGLGFTRDMDSELTAQGYGALQGVPPVSAFAAAKKV